MAEHLNLQTNTAALLLDLYSRLFPGREKGRGYCSVIGPAAVTSQWAQEVAAPLGRGQLALQTALEKPRITPEPAPQLLVILDIHTSGTSMTGSPERPVEPWN